MEMHSHSLPQPFTALAEPNSYESFTKPINLNTCVIIRSVPQGVDAIRYRFLEVFGSRFLQH